MTTTKWVSEEHKVGLVNWNEAWLLISPYPLKLVTEVYRGSLVFRIPKTSRRIAYKALKRDLRKREIIIREEPLPF